MESEVTVLIAQIANPIMKGCSHWCGSKGSEKDYAIAIRAAIGSKSGFCRRCVILTHGQRRGFSIRLKFTNEITLATWRTLRMQGDNLG